MGNRAVITDEKRKIGVYLHWNGGRDSVEAFLLYCKLKGCPSISSDAHYGYARLVQVIANFFGGTDSIGIGPFKELDKDNGNNGVYIVKDWDIVGREHAPSVDQQVHDLLDLLLDINKAQPESERVNYTDIIAAANDNRGTVERGDLADVRCPECGDRVTIGITKGHLNTARSGRCDR